MMLKFKPHASVNNDTVIQISHVHQQNGKFIRYPMVIKLQQIEEEAY
jgi:hypothetical protein